METTRPDHKSERQDHLLPERPGRASVETVEAQARRGLVPAVLGLSVDVTEDALTGVIGLADDLRKETRQAVVATLDFADSLARSALGLGRRSVERLDRFAVGALTGAERLTVGT